MASNITFSYSAPEISEDGDHVDWTWTLTNDGDATADNVVFTSRINPDTLKVTGVSGDGQSEITNYGTRVTFASVAPGLTLTGSLGVDLPADLSGSVSISGRAVWQKEDTLATS